MKPATQDRYAARIERAVALIANRLEEPPSLEELAAKAAISPFHFHRVYRAMTGETAAETTRRLRIARAASLLAEAARTVTDIAFEVGYESSQSFAKAFRQVAGVSASEARAAPDRLAALAETLARPAEIAAHDAPLEISIVSVEPFKAAALRRIGPHRELYHGYEALFGWATEAGLVSHVRGIWGVPLDDQHGTADADRVFDCCIQLDAAFTDDAAASVRAIELGDGEVWARARHVGPYEALDDFYDLLYPQLLALPEYEIAEGATLNCYIDTPEDSPPEKRRTDVHVPLRRIDRQAL
ncbi:MAG: AraC family transcriptional regulator [Maricaulaceae bacterium]|jgi:AraC family transcriptional regulator